MHVAKVISVDGKVEVPIRPDVSKHQKKQILHGKKHMISASFDDQSPKNCNDADRPCTMLVEHLSIHIKL